MRNRAKEGRFADEKERHMLFGTLESFDARQCGHEGIVKALEWAKANDLAALESGRYDIDGEALFLNLNEYETKLFEECKFEAHKRYIDVHFMVSGVERIDSQDTGKCDAEPFNEEGDFMLLDGEAATQVVLTPGTFAAYFPEDAHKPGIAIDAPAHVKKGVFKVLL